jgi:hypothetical protein
MSYYLFNIGEPYTDQWWARNRSMGFVSTGFDNTPGDEGEQILRSLNRDDWVIAYASGWGAIGAGQVGGEDTYRLVRPRDLPAGWESRHRHLRDVKWVHYVELLTEAVPFRKLNILARSIQRTKTRLADQKGPRIIQLLAAKSNGAPPTATPEAADLQPPGRVPSTTYRILRDTAKSRRVKALHGFKCQVCGKTIELSDGSRYAEGHHIQPLGGEHKGPDVDGNILCLCPNHHAELDLGVSAIRLSSLRSPKGHVVEQVYVDYHNRVIYGSQPGKKRGRRSIQVE